MKEKKNFGESFPKLVDEWHVTKNGDHNPFDFTTGSSIKFWWKCERGHEWETTIKERSRGSRCPYCTGNKTSFENSLKYNYPEIAAQWHPLKNSITPDKVSVKSGKKVTWICSEGHEWVTAVSERTRGYGCPYCSGRYASKTNNLKLIYPDIAQEWNYEKNLDIVPEECTPKSGKKVWWRCSKSHEWEMAITHRTSHGQNCPYCSGKRPSKDYNLATYNPQLSNEWHPTKNGNLTPHDFTPKSGKRVWWKGDCGHEWDSKISLRDNGHGCPYCAGKRVAKDESLLCKFPLIANEWHDTKNHMKKPENYLPGSMEIVWWRCKKGHEWKASINNRVYKKSNCPRCFGATSFNEQAVYFYVKKVFTDTLNRYIIDNEIEIDVYIPSLRLGIEYDGLFFHSKPENVKRDEDKNKKLYEKGIKLIRIRNPEAPQIKSYNSLIVPVMDDRDLKNVEIAIRLLLDIISPNRAIMIDIEKDYGTIMKLLSELPIEKTVGSISKLVHEWHEYKNGELKPHMVLTGSSKKVWWKCSKGHEWEAVIGDRVRMDTKCPFCINKRVDDSNSLATLFPKVASEWHPTKNGLLTANNVVPGSARKIWWKCKKGHEWINTPHHRTNRKQICPYCSGQKINLENSIYSTHPHLVNEWHPLKNSISPKEVSYGSTKRVWWKCKKGHELPYLL